MNATLCFLKTKDKILLGMKKRGFGKGKYNGFGGKIGNDETIEDAVVREVFEEIGIKTSKDHLENVGKINYTFPKKSEWNQVVHIFFVKAWEGEPKESEEMTAEWFDFKEIPFEKMWENDRQWLPLILKGKKIDGSVTHADDNSSTKNVELKEL